MDEKRIKLAEDNFRNYLNQGLIKKAPFQDIIYQTYVNNSLESLKVAEEIFTNKTSSLWVVVSSYYSMFYIASAYIYKKGYKSSHEIVHQIINEALIVLARHDLEKHFLEEYEEEKDKALSSTQNLLEVYGVEKTKRSEFQYETTGEIKESKAKTSLERAKNFVAILRILLSKQN
jgi:uncharacterized protein (UPF0332 family)